MRKKILKILICTVLAAVLSMAVTGCTLFEHNYEKDYSQPVAKIAAVHDEYYAVDEDGNDILDESGNRVKYVFDTEEKTIYKSQLVNLWNSNASSYIGTLGAEGTAEFLLDQLVQRELLLIEIDRMIEFKLMTWNQRDKNIITESVYNSIDSLIDTLTRKVLNERDEPVADEEEDKETSTTYPTPSVEEPEEDEDPDKWYPDINNYLAIGSDPVVNSREREVARRLVDELESYVKDDIIATDKQKSWFKRDIDKMRNLILQYREQDIYPMLYDYDYDPETDTGNGTYIVQYLWGRSASESRKMARLQETVKDSVTVSADEIQNTYYSMLGTQQASYTNASTYRTAMTSDTENVIYTPDSNYFYVKHILIPFTDEQKNDITAYGKTHTKAETLAYREARSKEIVSYPHVNGEDDKSRPMSITSIFNTITSKMSPYRYSPRDAERKFDELIYEYGTDPGSFGNVKGYAVRYNLNGESESYMKEFAAAARDMYDTIEVGQVYSKPVVTDYGVHIMYFASKTEEGAIKSLKDYQTNAQYKTVGEAIEESLRTTKENAAYSDFVTKTIARYEEMEDADKNGIIEKFSNRYKDLYS